MLNRKGFIKLYLGSMRSSKSNQLFKIIDEAKYIKDSKVCLVRPIVDNRPFVSRKGQIDCPVIQCNELGSVWDQLRDYNIICIDEGQFIPDIGRVSDILAYNGAEIYIAALNGDAERKPWAAISELLPYVDYIERLSGVCEECKEKATTFTYIDKKRSSQIEIGDDVYAIYCRTCWDTKNRIKESRSV